MNTLPFVWLSPEKLHTLEWTEADVPVLKTCHRFNCSRLAERLQRFNDA